MSGDIAIRYGQKLPKGYQKMKLAACSKCRATFWIVQQQQSMDVKRTKVRVESLKGILVGEHDNRNYKDHLNRYDLDQTST